MRICTDEINRIFDYRQRRSDEASSARAKQARLAAEAATAAAATTQRATQRARWGAVRWVGCVPVHAAKINIQQRSKRQQQRWPARRGNNRHGWRQNCVTVTQPTDDHVAASQGTIGYFTPIWRDMRIFVRIFFDNLLPRLSSRQTLSAAAFGAENSVDKKIKHFNCSTNLRLQLHIAFRNEHRIKTLFSVQRGNSGERFSNVRNNSKNSDSKGVSIRSSLRQP